MRAKFPSEANIQFVSGTGDIPGTHTLYLAGRYSDPDYLGRSPLNERNAQAGRTGWVYITNIREYIYEQYALAMENNDDLWRIEGITFPLTLDQIVNIIVNTGCHETGHMLGLVSEKYLGGENGHHKGEGSGETILDEPQNAMNYLSSINSWRVVP